MGNFIQRLAFRAPRDNKELIYGQTHRVTLTTFKEHGLLICCSKVQDSQW